MQGRTISQALLLALGLVAGLDAAAQATTDAKVFGGWRNLHSENGAEPALEDIPFAMLPAEAAKGTRFAVLDREGKRTVCCMVVTSDRLDAAALEQRYRLPGVWISDVLNEGTTESRPYEPRVYEMKRDGALQTYAFFDAAEAYSDLGGLLLPPSATLDAAGNVKVGADRYTLQFQSTAFADDDGALDRFTLRPVGKPGKPVIVEVPYGTY
ncbi:MULTISPECIES: decarboxylase [Stenotrophomonas]|uniref:decarboxylase n=1 Tax=Stenotrophomonas TaxID=40323 RepID=UPI001FF09645|nr:MULTISPECIES: decarboxylase [Stenotrophomonas]